VGLVAPTSAEYRLLGTNDAFLGSLRAATGGHEIDQAIGQRPDTDLERMRDQQHEYGRAHDGDVMPCSAKTRCRTRSAPRRGHDPSHDRGVDRDIDEAANSADGELAVHGSGIDDSRSEGKSGG
jgi:hypothetical protein